MNRTRIKICGLREPAHARLAAEAGADAVGLVFHDASPRNVTLDEARAVSEVLPPFVMAVGLFVDAPRALIEAALAAVPLDLLQFHGDEPPEFCASFPIPFLKAIRMGPGTDLVEWAHRFSRAKALLLDAHVPGQPGGTGHTFDWGSVPGNLPLPIVLSGGLDAANVGRAMREVKPWAVDVSSGVEARRGTKDPQMILDFIRSVRLEDAKPSR